MYREIEGYYCLIRSMKLHYGATSANVALRSRGSHRSLPFGRLESVIERGSGRIDSIEGKAALAGVFRNSARA